MSADKPFRLLDPAHVDPTRVKRERDKARALRKTSWWLDLANRGTCHYCQKKFAPGELTMDHVLPIARGGTSTPGNIVPACRACNRDKKLETPVDDAFAQLEKERAARGGDSGGDPGSDD